MYSDKLIKMLADKYLNYTYIYSKLYFIFLNLKYKIKLVCDKNKIDST